MSRSSVALQHPSPERAAAPREPELVFEVRAAVIAPSAFEIYQQLDLGPGGYAIAPSTDSRRGVQEALTGKRAR